MESILPTDSRSDHRPGLGARGEVLAAAYLAKNGYQLIISNFKAPVGRNTRGSVVTGEIDLIALDGHVLCFIEVKTRTSDALYDPVASVDLRKQRQITRTAKVYRTTFDLWARPYRYDVVSIVLPPNGEPILKLAKAFWNDEKFKKRRWENEDWRRFQRT